MTNTSPTLFIFSQQIEKNVSTLLQQNTYRPEEWRRGNDVFATAGASETPCIFGLQARRGASVCIAMREAVTPWLKRAWRERLWLQSERLTEAGWWWLDWDLEGEVSFYTSFWISESVVERVHSPCPSALDNAKDMQRKFLEHTCFSYGKFFCSYWTCMNRACFLWQ